MSEEGYNVRVVQTPRHREIWLYGKKHVPDTTPKVRLPARKPSELDAGERFERELRRRKYYVDRRQVIRRLVDSNYVHGVSKFVTLTYADPPDFGRKFHDLAEAYRWIEGEWDWEAGAFVGGHLEEFQAYLDRCTADFKDFMARLRYDKDEPVEYLAVWEIQGERLEEYGDLVLHWHFIGFNLPYVSKRWLQQIWGHGIADIRLIKNAARAGTYVSKYFGKALVENGRFGRRAYRRSRGVRNPDGWLDLLDAEQVECVVDGLGETLYDYEYSTPMGESIRYVSIPLDGLDAVKEPVRPSG